MPPDFYRGYDATTTGCTYIYRDTEAFSLVFSHARGVTSRDLIVS